MGKPVGKAAQDRFLSRVFDHYAEFLAELWLDRRLDRIAPLGVIELDIADYAANGPPMRGILAPRGLGKTHIVTAGLAEWRVFRNNTRKVIIPSKSEKEAKKTLRLIRGWINSVWFLQHLAPSRNHIDSATQFDVGTLPASEAGRQPSVTAIGIDGQLEGNRGNTIIPDDVETEKNTESVDAREGLDDRVKEFKDILYPNLQPDLKRAAERRGETIDVNEICYVGTLHHEETLYVKLQKRHYNFRTWTILYPTPTQKVLNLAPKLVQDLEAGRAKPGDLVLPYRFDRGNVAEKQAEGYRRFAMQHMLICDLGESNQYPLRLSDLIVTEANRDRAPLSIVYATRDNDGSTAIETIPHDGFAGARLHRPAMIGKEWAPYVATHAWIDPAGRGADHTAVSIVGHLAGYMWLKCCMGMPGGSSEEDMTTLVKLCRQHGAKSIFIESNADTLDTYRPMFESILRKHYLEPGTSDEYPEGWKAALVTDTKITHSTRQKEVRIIEAIEPILSNHRLVTDPKALHQEGMTMEGQLWYQLSRMTRQTKALKEDAKADSLAGCLRTFSHTLRMDPSVAAERQRERSLDSQTQAIEKLFGPKNAKEAPRWAKPW